jgi:prepilin-type processing-associated H-X9-DG protein
VFRLHTAIAYVLAAATLLPAGCNKSSSSSGGSSSTTAAESAPQGPAFGSDPVSKVRMAAARTQSQNNLKMIGIAMHAYHDTNHGLPTAASFAPDGKPLLSWRVAILPYIEELDLYKQFKLDEPWDSEHNKTLIAKMPKTYALPLAADAKDGVTHYCVFANVVGSDGLSTLFPWPAPKTSGPPRGITLAQITNLDGSSNTIMAVEAAEGVPWTKPDELMYNPKGPLPKLGGFWNGATNVAFADGSVRTLSDKVPEATLRALITFNDGILVGDY